MVEFTIEADGTVRSILVIEATNQRFAREVTRAVARWRYRPQMRDGRPYAREGVRVRIEFKLSTE